MESAMSVRRLSQFKPCGVAVAAGGVLLLALAATAGAQDVAEPPAPGNLIANWGFDADTSGWGSFGGTLTRTDDGSSDPCSPNAGVATVVQRAGSVYSISDSQGGYQPTVRSTVAGETFIAYATVTPTSASAAGKPARIVLRERVGTTGTIIKESVTAFTMPRINEAIQPVVSATALRSGSTLGLRIEQTSAQPGDAFELDNVFLRRGTPAFGPAAPGTTWTTMSNDVSRVSIYSALDANGTPDRYTRYLPHLRVYLDGRGGAGGSQRLRAVVYAGIAAQSIPVRLVGVSREVAITSGTSARWVDFAFDTPVLLSGNDGATYQFGLQSGPTRNVARYASTSRPGALWWGPDGYADGPNQNFGTTEPNGASPTWSTDDKHMSIQGIAAATGVASRSSCWD
jgi:hypothetical protein